MTDRGAGFAIESAETAAFINVTFRKNVRTPALEEAAAQTAQQWRVVGARGAFPPEALPSRTWQPFLRHVQAAHTCPPSPPLFPRQVAALRGGGGWCNSPLPVQLFVSQVENNTAAVGGGLFAHGNCT